MSPNNTYKLYIMDRMQFTDKVEKTLAAAQDLAREFSHVQLAPAHIASALFDETDGSSLFKSVINKAGGDAAAAERSFKRLLVRLPTQDPPPPEITLSPQVAKLLRSAQEHQKKQKDTYISVDHIILALLDDPAMLAPLQEAGTNKKAIENAVTHIRGSTKVESKSAEEQYEGMTS